MQITRPNAGKKQGAASSADSWVPSLLPGNLHSFPRKVIICLIDKYLNLSPKVSVEGKYSYIQVKGYQPPISKEYILKYNPHKN